MFIDCFESVEAVGEAMHDAMLEAVTFPRFEIQKKKTFREVHVSWG